MKKTAMSSNRAWLRLLLAGLLEILWATGLKYPAIPLVVVVIALAGTFDLLIKAAKVLPVGTAYAVFAAIGTVGTVIVEAFLSRDGINFTKMGIIALLLVFIIGLKLTGEGEEA